MASLAFSQSFEGLPCEIHLLKEQLAEAIPPTSASVARSLRKIAKNLIDAPKTQHVPFDSVDLIGALNMAWTLYSSEDIENQIFQILLAYVGNKDFSKGREDIYMAAAVFIPRALECLHAHPNELAVAYIDANFSGPGKDWIAQWMMAALKKGDEAGGGFGGGDFARYVDTCAALPLCSDAGSTHGLLLSLFRVLRAGQRITGATKRLEASLDGPLDLSVIRNLANGDSFRDNVRLAGIALKEKIPIALEYQEKHRLVTHVPPITSAAIPEMAGYAPFVARVLNRIDADVKAPLRFGGFIQQIFISVLGIGAFIVNPQHGSGLKHALADAAAAEGASLSDDWLTRAEIEHGEPPTPHEYTLWPWSAIKSVQGRDGCIELLPFDPGDATVRFDLKDADTLWSAMQEGARVRPVSIDMIWLPKTKGKKLPPPLPEAQMAADAYKAAKIAFRAMRDDQVATTRNEIFFPPDAVTLAGAMLLSSQVVVSEGGPTAAAVRPKISKSADIRLARSVSSGGGGTGEGWEFEDDNDDEATGIVTASGGQSGGAQVCADVVGAYDTLIIKCITSIDAVIGNDNAVDAKVKHLAEIQRSRDNHVKGNLIVAKTAALNERTAAESARNAAAAEAAKEAAKIAADEKNATNAKKSAAAAAASPLSTAAPTAASPSTPTLTPDSKCEECDLAFNRRQLSNTKKCQTCSRWFHKNCFNKWGGGASTINCGLCANPADDPKMKKEEQEPEEVEQKAKGKAEKKGTLVKGTASPKKASSSAVATLSQKGAKVTRMPILLKKIVVVAAPPPPSLKAVQSRKRAASPAAAPQLFEPKKRPQK